MVENPIDIFINEHLSESLKKSEEVFKFTRDFQRSFPIESIKNMTLEDYLYVPYDEYNPSMSFCSRIWRDGEIMSHRGNARTNSFGIYTINNQIKIYGKYLAPYDDDVDAAFDYLKSEIFKLLKEVDNDNYIAVERCPINRAFSYKLLEIYFPEKILHVHTENTLNDYCKCVGLEYDPKQELIYRNLALVNWKESVPEIRNWDNHVLMSFCDWLWRHNLKIDGGALSRNTQKVAMDIDNQINEIISEGIEKEAIVKVRVNQAVFRDLLIKKYDRCCLCGVSNRKLLVASHMKPWSVCKPEEKLDVNNGLLMCPNHDKLFDQGYISFDDDGKIIISKRLSQVDCVYMNVNDGMKIDVNDSNREYLRYHRNNIFE
ncbi:MAG: HNH endonuclease [Butyrivibrio sp.]|jgi:hypothetical protein|nr:HNH endonuclease [Butyrivibrio sp.]